MGLHSMGKAPTGAKGSRTHAAPASSRAKVQRSRAQGHRLTHSEGPGRGGRAR